MATILRQGGELTAGVQVVGKFCCGKCQAAIKDDVWLCSTCWNEREAKLSNKYGLIRHEGVEYVCDCFGSGSDEKGNRWILEKSKHALSCKLSQKGKKISDEPLCDCPSLEKDKDGNPLPQKDKHGNYKIIFRPEKHEQGCHIRRLIQESKNGSDVGII